MRELSQEQKKAADIARSGTLSAGAGSGKTMVLVARYLRLLRAGVEPRRIVVMTFMRKAAAELRERIDSDLAEALRQGSLEGERLDDGERARLSGARSRLTDGHIGTIHSFCRGVLVEEPALMPERPGFTELGNAESLRLRERAQSAAAWASEPGTSPLARLLESGLSRGGLRFITRGLLNRRWELEQVRRALDGGGEALVRLVEDGLAALLDEFRREAAGTWDYINRLFEDPAAVEYLRGKSGAEGEEGLDPDAFSTLARVRDALAPLYAGEPPPSFETLNRFIGLRELKTGAQKCAALQGRNPFLEVRDELVGKLLPDAPSDLEWERRGLGLAEELLRWMEQVEGGYAGLKVESCSTDYEDLLDKVLVGLRDNPELVRSLRSRFRHFLVDEFQDTDPRQWEIIRALALPDEEEARDGSRTLFIVGDRKQAIFGFRGGDNTVFLRAEEELRSVPRSFHLPLEDNYRSRQGILDFVNPIFDRLFAADAGPGGGLLYPTAVEPQWMKVRRSEAEGGTVSLVNTTGLKGEPLEALATAGVIRAILEGGADGLPGLGSCPADQDGPVVGVLARKGKQLALLTAACERLGLGGSFSVARGRGIFATEEAGWLRCVLDALVDPRDEVSLAAACLSPFLGLTYDDLMEAQGSGSSWSAELLNGGSPGLEGRWADLRERWGRWSRLAAMGSVSRLAAAVLADSGVEAAMKTAGCPDRWRRLEYILELIRSEERVGGLSGPADAAVWMRENREEEDFGQPVPESAPVVLMTMHGAKGLQFPIVVLPFLKGKIAGDRSGCRLARLPDGGRMLAVRLRQEDPPYERKETFLGFLLRRSAETEGVLEEKRLFYTACTRARDHLVLVSPFDGGAVGDLTGSRAGEKPGEWLERLLAAEDDRLFADGREVGLLLSGEDFVDCERTEPSPPSREEPRLDLLGPVAVHDPPVIASSALAELEKCPVRFYLKRSLRVDEDEIKSAVITDSPDDYEPQLDEEAGARGSAFGKAFHYLVGVAGNKLPKGDDIRRLLRGAPERHDFDSDGLGALQQHLSRLNGIAVWREARRSEVRFEVQFRAELGGCLLLGCADALAWTPEGVRLFDFKTNDLTGVTPEELACKRGYDVQLGAYAAGLEAAFGLQVAEAHLLFTAEGGGAVEVDLDEIRPRVEGLLRRAAELARRPFAELVREKATTDCGGCGLVDVCPARRV